MGKKYVRMGKNKGCAYPRHMVFLDTESVVRRIHDEDIHIPYLWGCCYVRVRGKDYNKYHEEWRFFDNEDEFWDWVVSKCNKKNILYVFTHNPSYDMIAGKVYKMCMKYGFKAEFYHEKGLTYILKVANGDKKITVLNTGQWYQGKLEKIAPLFGLKKGELNHRKPLFSDAVLYNRMDVQIIKTAMLEWFKFCIENDLGNFGITPAKQSLNAYKHRFGGDRIVLHGHEDATKLERESYYGGRTEAHFIGKVPCKRVITLDINSMYPFVMKTYQYPVRFVGYEENISLKRLFKHMRDYLVIAKVRVKVDKSCVPCRINKRIYFPVGEFDTALCQPELCLVMKYGKILKVYSVAVYEKDYIFKDFVDFFYGKRLEAKEKGDKIRDKQFKIILNSLYGKFAQKSPHWEIVGECNIDEVGYEEGIDYETGKPFRRKRFLGKIWESVEEGESFESFPAISSFVTSYARVTLFNYINKAGEGHNFYNDTDSLFVDEEGFNRLIDCVDNFKLGYLKREADKEDLIIHGPKDYEWKDGMKLKGVPKEAVQVSENAYEYWSWDKTATYVHHRDICQYKNRKVVKRLKRVYLKGWVLDSGWVVPFEMCIVNGQNNIISWENTSYAKKGLKLKDSKQIDEVTKAFKGAYGLETKKEG